MKVQYFKEYSKCLNRDMEFKVYGHAGKPILVFPAQDGRYYDFENFKMVDSVYDLIDDGKVQLFCCDSIDKESWSLKNGDNRHRIYIHEQWYYYIINELVPRIFDINSYNNYGRYYDGIITTGCSLGATHAVNFMFRRPDIFKGTIGLSGYYDNSYNNYGRYYDGIITTGCSLGATHAVNFMFRRPDIFKGTIGLSGYYDTDIFFDNYCDELVYNNSPIKYIEGMYYNHPNIYMYRNNKIVLCCGQGAWEDLMISSINIMKELLNYKNIPAWIDVWGEDVDHDWNWWQIQFPYFLKNII